MSYVLVVYDTTYGSTAALAQEIAHGIESSGVEAKVRCVAKAHPATNPPIDDIPANGSPYVTLEELKHCQGLALGSPTRFGNMSASVKAFLDSTGGLWNSGCLVDKPACVFTSTSSLHGGQESTLLSMMVPLFHHGMILLGLPFFPEYSLNDTDHTATPYGASHHHFTDDAPLHTKEITCARALGKRLGATSLKLSKND